MGWRRLIAVFVAFLVWLPLPAAAWAQAASCQFVLGFQALHDLAPGDIGDCTDNQASAANGDALQHTLKGLMAWRKADNWTAFTNGYMTWINGPSGLMSRLNTQRFPFEHDVGSLAGTWACSTVLVRIKPDGSGVAVRFKQPWLSTIQATPGVSPASLMSSAADGAVQFQVTGPNTPFDRQIVSQRPAEGRRVLVGHSYDFAVRATGTSGTPWLINYVDPLIYNNGLQVLNIGMWPAPSDATGSGSPRVHLVNAAGDASSFSSNPAFGPCWQPSSVESAMSGPAV
jgi:hypothetical protein